MSFGIRPIAGFHCHTIIKTIQQIKSRFKEIKEDEYTNSLARIRVCAMFRAEIFEEMFYSNSHSKALCGDAMFVSLLGAQIWRPEANKKDMSLSFAIKSL